MSFLEIGLSARAFSSFRGPDGGESINELNEFSSIFRTGSDPYCVLGFMLRFILRTFRITVPLNTGDSHEVWWLSQVTHGHNDFASSVPHGVC